MAEGSILSLAGGIAIKHGNWLSKNLRNWLKGAADRAMKRLAALGRLITEPARFCIRPLRRLWWRANTAAFRRCIERAGKNVAAQIFVKIGANDGVTGDPCSDLLISGPSWHGLLIEPVPYCCDRLRQNFPDTSRFRVVEAAIDTRAGTRDLYFVRRDARTSLPDLPIWYDQLGTFDSQHIEKHFGPRIIPFVERKPVAIRTYSDVMTDSVEGEYALLHVDTEGHDFEILKMALAYQRLPHIIFIEHAHLSRADRKLMIRALKDHGYVVRNCGMDFFAFYRDPSA